MIGDTKKGIIRSIGAQRALMLWASAPPQRDVSETRLLISSAPALTLFTYTQKDPRPTSDIDRSINRRSINKVLAFHFLPYSSLYSTSSCLVGWATPRRLQMGPFSSNAKGRSIGWLNRLIGRRARLKWIESECQIVRIDRSAADCCLGFASLFQS